AYLDRRSIRFLDKEIFTDVTSGERHEVDVAALARFRGQDSCFIVHIETQGQKQKRFEERMFDYFARLWMKFRLPIYPIAIFSHDSPVLEPDTFQIVFPDLEVMLSFSGHSTPAAELERFRTAAQSRGCGLDGKMGFKPSERVQVKLECLRLLATFK